MNKDFVNLGRTLEEKNLIDQKAAVYYLERRMSDIQKVIIELKQHVGNETKFNNYLHNVQKTTYDLVSQVRQCLSESFCREFAKKEK